MNRARRSQNGKGLLEQVGWPALGLGVFAAIWSALTLVVRDPLRFPGPLDTFLAALGLLTRGYAVDFLATLARASAGWVGALVLGVPLGLTISYKPTLYLATSGILAFLRSLPAFMLITVPVVLGASAEVARLGIVVLACAVIMIDDVAESMRSMPTDRVELVRAFGGTPWFLVTNVLFFEALGRAIVPSARITVGISFIVAVVVEMLLVPSSGIGARLLTEIAADDMRVTYGFICLSGLAGVGFNLAIVGVSRRAIFWHD